MCDTLPTLIEDGCEKEEGWTGDPHNRPAGAGVEEASMELGVSWRRWYILAVFSLMSLVQVRPGPGGASGRRLEHVGPDRERRPVRPPVGEPHHRPARQLGHHHLPPAGAAPHQADGGDGEGGRCQANLRTATILASGLMTLGSVLRCGRTLFNNGRVFLVSCHLCAVLNGISGITVMAAPPLLSSIWFPPKERTMATAINQVNAILPYLP